MIDYDDKIKILPNVYVEIEPSEFVPKTKEEIVHMIEESIRVAFEEYLG